MAGVHYRSADTACIILGVVGVVGVGLVSQRQVVGISERNELFRLFS